MNGACTPCRWGTDKYAFGSYSFLATGSTPDDNKNLEAPVGGGKVLFAGEATSYKYFGTVHGAYLSGQAAAKRILTSNFRTEDLC